jgi:hypothetical protein
MPWREAAIVIGSQKLTGANHFSPTYAFERARNTTTRTFQKKHNGACDFPAENIVCNRSNHSLAGLQIYCIPTEVAVARLGYSYGFASITTIFHGDIELFEILLQYSHRREAKEGVVVPANADIQWFATLDEELAVLGAARNVGPRELEILLASVPNLPLVLVCLDRIDRIYVEVSEPARSEDTNAGFRPLSMM